MKFLQYQLTNFMIERYTRKEIKHIWEDYNDTLYG